MSTKRKAEGIALLSMYNDEDSEEELEESQDGNRFSNFEEASISNVEILESEEKDLNGLELLTSQQVKLVSSTLRNGGDFTCRAPGAGEPLDDLKGTSEHSTKNFSPARKKSARISSNFITARIVSGKETLQEMNEKSKKNENDEIFSAITEKSSNGNGVHHSPMDVDDMEEGKEEGGGKGDKTEGGEGKEEDLKAKLGEKGSEEEEYEKVLSYFPSLPSEECSSDLQAKFSRYLELKRIGKSLNKAQRESKGYRNPNFMQKVLEHEGIAQYGSNFENQIFDPNGFDPSDFFDAIVLEQRKELERKDKERRMKNQIEFQKGEIQIQNLPNAKFQQQQPLVHIVAPQKTSLGIPNPMQAANSIFGSFPIIPPSSISSNASLALSSTSSSFSSTSILSSSSSVLTSSQSSSVKVESRSKRSKWDKMETTQISTTDLRIEAEKLSKKSEKSHHVSKSQVDKKKRY